MEIPQLQIRQTYAQLSIDADPGQFSMHLPRADVRMHITQPRSDHEPGSVFVRMDQSTGFANLGTGKHMNWSENIYSQTKGIVLQGILRRIEDGERMMNKEIGSDPIPELAAKNSKLINSIDYGQRNFPYVQFHVEEKKAKIEVIPGKTDVEITPQQAQVAYTRGKLEIGILREPEINLFI